jgi:3',5'-cyclic AMP phosphodiesterase CpdA
MTTTLVTTPLLFNPTKNSFSVNCIATGGDPSNLSIEFGLHSSGVWVDGNGSQVIDDVARFTVSNLSTGTQYDYRIVNELAAILYTGTVRTLKDVGPVTFAVISDTHIVYSPSPASAQQAVGIATLQAVTSIANNYNVDFAIHMGDGTGYPSVGFNAPPTDTVMAKAAYLNLLGCVAPISCPCFLGIGNWEGESGQFGNAIEIAMSQRLKYFPGPFNSTYNEGGSQNSDYYAFVSGDILFVVLNSETYTTTVHTSAGNTGTASNWTLGTDQLAWLEKTLSESPQRWKFIFAHHSDGGNGKDNTNSVYGRGGGRAVAVGEQATIQAMMLQYGVQVFFYGHDHLFTNLNENGIQYFCCSTTGSFFAFSPLVGGYESGTYQAVGGWLLVNVDNNVLTVSAIEGDNRAQIYKYTFTLEMGGSHTVKSVANSLVESNTSVVTVNTNTFVP